MNGNIEAPSELESIKEIATNMGIKVGNTKDVAKIKEMIAEKSEPKKPTITESAKMTKMRAHGAIRKKAMALVRVMITPMSPFERQLENTLVDVGSAMLGQVKRIVPFNEEWHVEQIVLDALRDRKFRTKRERTDPVTKRKIYSNVFSPSYGIVLLDALSPEEIKELAADQRARHAID